MHAMQRAGADLGSVRPSDPGSRSVQSVALHHHSGQNIHLP